MLLHLLFVALGGLLLYKGADWLVEGAAGLARSFGIAPIVIGLTVVGYGTSAPELVVSLLAAAEGRGGIALGNVVGSNIANLGLILGVTALLRPPIVDGGLAWREIPVLLVATCALPVLLGDGVIGRPEGALLLVGSLAFSLFTVWLSRRVPPESPLGVEAAAEAALEATTGPRLRRAGVAALGLAVLVGGGNLLVDGASGIAARLGMSERLIGLTIVAVGTSLPELATSTLASARGHAEIAVGNIVGSNIFNLLLVLGAAALARPVEEPFGEVALDLAAMVALTFVGALFMRSARSITRQEGALLMLGYAAFLASTILRG